MRTIVLGGTGNFGARICRALAASPSMQVVATCRYPRQYPANALPTAVALAALDTVSPHLASALRALEPDLVIHCAGPFQGQDYRVAEAALACGAHYIDLSDGREFVTGFTSALDDIARRAKRLAVTGASTLPALSSAVIDAMSARFSCLTSIDTVIAPAQSAPRGTATIAGVLGYAGMPHQVWEAGTWRTRHGWQHLQRVDLGPAGRRWSAVCDVPDLALFPARYPGVRDVRFRAALEVGAQHWGIAVLAAMRRVGVTFSIAALAPALDRAAGVFDIFGSETGGMTVTLAGICTNGKPLALRWHVIAPQSHGPEIPAMPAILLARKIATGNVDQIGAMPCMGLLTLDDFTPEFVKWGMQTGVTEIV
jgi:saccharopine dehydrogenase-like NADP-dependent oxidoreductase